MAALVGMPRWSRQRYPVSGAGKRRTPGARAGLPTGRCCGCLSQPGFGDDQTTVQPCILEGFMVCGVASYGRHSGGVCDFALGLEFCGFLLVESGERRMSTAISGSDAFWQQLLDGGGRRL